MIVRMSKTPGLLNYAQSRVLTTGCHRHYCPSRLSLPQRMGCPYAYPIPNDSKFFQKDFSYVRLDSGLPTPPHSRRLRLTYTLSLTTLHTSVHVPPSFSTVSCRARILGSLTFDSGINDVESRPR